MVAKRPGLAAFATLAVALLLASGASAAPRALEVAKPRLDQLLTAKRVTVVLRTEPKLRKLAVRLDGKGVRGAFERVRPGVWQARLGRQRLRVGRNHLVASTVDKAGRKDVVASRFVLGKRRPGFLRLKVPGRVGSSAVAKVRMRSYPNLKFKATLNGRGVAGLFRRSFLPRRTAHLGANDGLRFGRNVLKVVAARGNGTYDVERRVIVVSRDRPLVGAGPDSFTAGTRAVTVGGGSSRPSASSAARVGATASRASDLRYRWKVVRRPKGSKAVPSSPTAARTRFRPDVVGTYRLQLTVTDGSGLRGSDVATVTSSVNAPPIGVPIETIDYEAATGSNRIVVGNEEFPQTAPVQAVFLDRGTLEVLDNETYPGSSEDAAALKQEIEQYGPQALVIVANPALGPGTAPVSGAFEGALELLGADSVPNLERGDAGWTVIGVPGSENGAYVQGGQNPNQNWGNVRGHLARGSSGLFTFVSGSTVPFDTSAPGAAPMQNRIKVGETVYESGALACAEAGGGFQVQVIYAETLEPPSAGTFTTNGCGSQSMLEELSRMTRMIAGAATSTPGPALVVVQSIGTPRNPGPLTESLWNFVGVEIEAIGGTARVFDEATSSYTLVGAVGIEGFPLTEASQTLTGAPARITGVLERNQLGAYAPLLVSPTGSTPLALTEVAYQPAQAWPASETPQEKAALEYVAELLDLPEPTPGSSCYVPAQPDVRSEYCNEKLRGEWAGFVGQVRTAECDASCQSENGFDLESWEAVKAELAGRGKTGEFFEFNAVQSTWELMRALQAPFGASGVDAEVELNKLAVEIEQSIKPPPAAPAIGNWLNILGTLLYTASYADFDDETLTPALLGALGGAIGIGAQYTSGPEGSPLLGEFRISAADLAVELAKRLQTGSEGIGTVGELIVTDYGKLRAVAENPAFAGFTPSTVAKATSELETGSRQWVYQTLFPSAYEVVNLKPGLLNPSLPGRVREYECEWGEGEGLGIGGTYEPFKPTANAEYRFAPLPPPPPTLAVLVQKGTELPGDESEAKIRPPTPPASLFEPLYKPLSEGGLGVYAPWFWRQAFGFPGPGVKALSC